MNLHIIGNKALNKRKYFNVLNKTRKCLAAEGMDDFRKSIAYIERFQCQSQITDTIVLEGFKKWRKPSEEILSDLKKLVKIDDIPLYIDENLCIAYSLESLMTYIAEAIKKITSQDIIETLWFRGHKEHTYKLIPALYRMKDGKELFYEDKDLSKVMEPLFKTFQVKVFGAKEIFQSSSDPIIATLATMQHYGVPTNVLDWSTSALTALYFAVEDQMLYSMDTPQNRDKPDKDAALWLLNPSRMNRAREFLKRGAADRNGINAMPIPGVYDDNPQFHEYLPLKISSINDKESTPQHPIAVYVPHVNARIKAQLGTFTLFSLKDEPKAVVTKKDNNGKMYGDLLQMQKFYEETAKDEYEPFLTCVRISRKCINNIADWLRDIGITKPVIYPELENISRYLTEEVKRYL